VPLVHTHVASIRRKSSAQPDREQPVNPARRARILYGLLLVVSAVFIVRLFYLQVIRHDYYAKAAMNFQLKEYQIPAERGTIMVQNGSDITALVLNEFKYTLFADPVYVREAEKAATELARITGGDATKYVDLLQTKNTRYVVLAKKLSREQHEVIEKLDVKGVGTREESYRTYPQGQLASQLLGFVNEEGKGQYGIEQSLDDTLSGQPGELRAITDARGVPLVSNPDNVITEPVKGETVTLTIDIGMQRQVEDILKAGLERSKSSSGSLVVMDPQTGAIKALANYPTYDPSKIADVKNLADLSNAATNSPFEVGSVMKTLTAATALDLGVVRPETAFYNDGFVVVDGRRITDVVDSTGTQTVESTLVKSLNTGAVWLLTQIGRGALNEQARQTWHEYMTKHYFLGQPTGVEQAGEADGFIPDPTDKGDGINITYANTSFGQGMAATPVQMAAALSSIVNGGTYYRPTLIHSVKSKDGAERVREPDVRRQNTVSATTSSDMMNLLEKVAAERNPGALRDGYRVGGKSGTAEFTNPENGQYYKDRFNGTYMGYVGGDKPAYVIFVRANDPKVAGFAGAVAGAPIFKDVSNMLLDNFGVTPKQ